MNPFEHIENLLSTPLTEDQKNILTRKFSSHMLSISTKTMMIPQARKLMKSIAIALCTETVAQMVKDGFVFNDMLGPAGQGKAVLYNVIRVADFAVLCGKVYLKGDVSSAQAQFAEVMASDLLHSKGKHPNIVQYEHLPRQPRNGILGTHYATVQAQPAGCLRRIFGPTCFLESVEERGQEYH